MSVHSSLDGVVTPVDPSNPTYSYTPVTSVTQARIDSAEEWATKFTDDHSAACASIVGTLWPDHYADADDWQSAVETLADDLETDQEQHATTDGVSVDADDLPDDLESTDDIDVLEAKVEAIDVRDVARQVCDRWDTAPNRSGRTRFAASWHIDHDSGTSCFATRDKFVDLSEGNTGGGAAMLVARADQEIDVNDCRDSLRGDDYWKAINKLREMGFEIPYFEGSDGMHPDFLGLYESAETQEEKHEQVAKALEL